MAEAPRRHLRIVQVAGLVSTKYGGFERFMVALARVSAERGHRLCCIWEATPSSEAFRKDLAAAGAESLVRPARGHRLMFLMWLYRLLRREKIDVIYSHFEPASLLSLLAGRLARVPLVLCMFHTGYSLQPGQTLSLRHRIISRVRLNLAHQVYTCSRAVGDEIHRIFKGGPRTRPFYLGVTRPVLTGDRLATRTRLGLAADDQVVTCVGFHDGPQKGLDILIKAVATLAPRFPRLRVVQIGAGSDPASTERLKRQAAEAGISDHILWLGLRDDVSAVLQSADLYCQPSRFEGLPLAIMEAMMVSLPIVASAVNGIPEAVIDGQTGLLVEKEIPEQLVAALDRLLTDDSERRRMGDSGRTRALAMFDVDRQARKMIRRFERLARTVGV